MSVKFVPGRSQTWAWFGQFLEGNYPGKWLICNGIEPIDLINEGHGPQSPSDFGKRRASDHANTPPPKRKKERTRPFVA